ncbi:hypothetical protein D0T84_13645 [Dysgonomonas sp. 521]|uniref:FISUMP domain-containing protein n=1 Tax=Dysgonomonas sp. 521 TaxID=2302932 RepID=UPI0013D8398F|nr:FISUMP domain-containing protein [Dysgonomonas sp. 521]NDV95946.1 hypothetical protein [Dysgonomonas sp. 521]
MKTTETRTKNWWKQAIAVFAFLVLTPGVYAQVTVGSNKEPESFSVLELISNNKTGLRMPHLTTAERNKMTTAFIGSPEEGLAKGLTIYNTSIDCMEFWNGKKWISTCDGECIPDPADVDENASVSSCLPYMFTYQTMNLTASYAGDTPDSYLWIVDGKCILDNNSPAYAYTPPTNIVLEEDDLGNWKKTVKITCQMGKDGNIVQAADYEILVIKATKGILSPIYVWALKEGDPDAGEKSDIVAFAHVNLGDENVTNPCDLAGDLYQWGRERDGNGTTTGHFRRNLTDLDVLPNGIAQDPTESFIAETADLDATTGQVLLTSVQYGKFIKSSSSDWRSTPKYDLWGDGELNYSLQTYNPTWKILTNNPCPTGWKIPSVKQWGAIFRGGIIDGTSSSSTSGSTWTWFGTDPVKGYKVADALYLPAAGYRLGYRGSLNYRGTSGYYWSSTAYDSDYSYGPFFNKFGVIIGYFSLRVTGQSVRCIKE